jgi:meiosis induction protein kinase IME2/SME1
MTTTMEPSQKSAATYGTSPMALEERFEVIKDIGDGSFGSVVLARVRTAGASVARRGTIVAIKTMKKTFESFTPCMELREVVFLRNLPQHPHLVPAYDIFLDPFTKKLHICMEYMDGNLYQLMKARDHKFLDNGSVKSILYQIMQGLEHIHAHHFFHRDIKPENILVSASGQNDGGAFRRYSGLVTPPQTPPVYTIKIADFGLARETHSKLPYTTYVSTRWYRAPEVLLRAGEYSAPVDIWAVGAMAVEIATLKPLFPGGNEVDQVWRVCEIMGSPGNWYNKAGARVGGGEWREGNRLAGKLGFSFPKMAPHAMDTILQSPQWPSSLSQFVTWCLMWDPKTRPTSTQALAHEYFTDAVDPLRPKSSASRMQILGRKQSDISHKNSKEAVSTTPTSAKPSWFRKSLIGRSETVESVVTIPQPSLKEPAVTVAPVPAPVVPAPAPTFVPRPVPVHAATTLEGQQQAPMTVKQHAIATGKRTTWANGPSNVAPMPILPTIRPISPLSDAVTAQANHYNDSYLHGVGEKTGKKIGRQLSINSSNHYGDMYRGQAGLASPPSAHKESFFSHLRKRARRISGRHQTPISPAYDDMEAQVGCGPWASNRSSMILDSQSNVFPRPDPYEGALKIAQPPQPPAVPPHVVPSHSLKRHHSVPKQQAPRSVDNVNVVARAPAALGSMRARRSQIPQGVQQYETPAEEDELLDEALNDTQRAAQRLENTQQASRSQVALPSPYPTPSPSASGNMLLFGDNVAVEPKPLDMTNKMANAHSWPTPPYEESEWAVSASASIWAASNRF